MSNLPAPLPTPDTNSSGSWNAHWKAQGLPWRTEPVIDGQRQQYLAEHLAATASTMASSPFQDVDLSRSDIEWLLATYTFGYRPVGQRDGDLHKHQRLDLRGAHLGKVNLSGLPLDGINLSGAHLARASLSEAYLRDADLSEAHLEGATLTRAHLEGSCLSKACLQQADLSGAHLEGADLSEVHLEGANLNEASIQRVYLSEAHLERANFSRARLEGAYLFEARSDRANFSGAHCEKAYLSEATLQGANLSEAHLEGAVLYQVHLEGANLNLAHLAGANLSETHLEGAILIDAHVEAATLSGTFFSSATNLRGLRLGEKESGFARLAGVRWGDVDLSVVDWKHVHILGDEYLARQQKSNGETMSRAARLDLYRTAVRANRQLAVALQGQGLNEEAARFAYRAQLLQRIVWRGEKKVGQYSFSLFLDLLAGYGYRPVRSLIAYLTIILGFMGLYLLNAHFVLPHLRWDEALVLSLSSFHGRGFFSQSITLGDTYARLAAAEAVIGLLVEICVIATFTQRFLGK